METKEKTNGESRVGELQTFASVLVSRLKLSGLLGQSYGGSRDLYEALGYWKTEELDFYKYYAQYLRQDIARAIIDRPVNATWRGKLEVIESDDDKDTVFEKKYKEIDNKFKLKSIFSRLDKITGIGKYGVLLIGTSDIRNATDLKNPIIPSQSNKIVYIKPVSEPHATIQGYVDDVKDPRYGHPKMYSLTITESNDGGNQTVEVHHSRVIHIVDDKFESEIEGSPRLESVFNRLMDLEKLIGGSAEMFWRGARPGYGAEVKDDYQLTSSVESALKDQFDEYEHNLRRILMLEGIKLNELKSQISDPKNHVDVQIQMISANKGIPKRILTGSERGELSSAQDKDEWLSYIASRRDEFAEPSIIRPFVDWCIRYKILPESENYSIKWHDLFSVSEKEKAEVGNIRAESLKLYADSISAQDILPKDKFFELVLGLKDEEIEIIQEMMAEELKNRMDEELIDFENEDSQE